MLQVLSPGAFTALLCMRLCRVLTNRILSLKPDGGDGLLPAHLCLLLSEVLAIILRVQIRPEHQDVTLGQKVTSQNAQAGGQDGANLRDRPEHRPERGKNRQEENPDDQTDEGGKGDAPGHVVPPAWGLHHEGAQEADKGQAAVVTVQEGKSSPGPGATHQQHLAGQGFVVNNQLIGA